ncbi:APC family permease [Vreelandella neptunia]|uniref:APC family permease n=1 Tax=Vreelandella neptunia TaxID=115551 RepID=UPI00315A7264
MKSDKHSSVLRSSGQDDSETTQLQGQMGPVGLALTVLAFAAPLASVVGVLPLVIMVGGVGAPLAFLAAMTILLLFSVGYTAMSRHLPNPGAFYAYVSVGINKTFGLGASFLAILGYWMIGLGVTIFFGLITKDFVEGTLGGTDVVWWVWSLALVVLVGILGYLRIDLSAKVLSVVMVVEIGIVLIFNIAVGSNGGPEGLSISSFDWGSLDHGSTSIAFLFAVITFIGFEATAIFREESREPQKTIPRATYLAVIFIGIFYVITTWLLVSAFGASQAQAIATANPPEMFVNALITYVGDWAGDIILALVVTSAFAAVLSCQNIIARYCHSLGMDEALPAILGKVHPRHGSPFVSSLVLSALFALGVVGFSASDPAVTYAWLAGAGGLPLLILMFLTSLSIVAFFRKSPALRSDTPMWQTTIAPIIAAMGLGITVYLSATNFVTLTGGDKSIATGLQSIILAFFVLGIMVATFYRVYRPAIYARIGRQTVN